MASGSFFSRSSQGWQHTFKLGKGPIPLNMNLRTLKQVDVGVLADSLGKTLLLLDNICFWHDCKDEDVVLNLK